MTHTITIEGKIPGQRKPLFPEWQMPLADGRLTLRAFLAQVVEAEVEAFRTRQQERRFVRALSAKDIEAGLMKGKVDAGGREDNTDVDTQEAIRTAIQAFEDGLFYVFIGETQYTELDEPISVVPDSRVTFIRLVALAGG
jgi:hypothetical protein